MKPFIAQIMLFAVAFATRLPFLFLGYGVEEDSWGHVLNAAEMAESGNYIISRLPGHPLFEGLLLILYHVHSPIVFNIGSALASALAVVVFYRIAICINPKTAFYWAIAFCFVPIFFVSGTYTIDYPYALLFLLLSLESVLKNKSSEAALWLAIATGFRITTLGFLLPLFVIIWNQAAPANSKALKLRSMFKLAFISVLISVFFYLPPIFEYGFGFFDFHKPPYPPIIEAMYKATIGVWGVLATPLILGVATYHYYKTKNVWRTVLISAFIIYGISYFRMPEKAAFWLPVVPLLLLYLSSAMQIKAAWGLAAVMVVSAFFFGINKTDPHTGAQYSSAAFTFGSTDGQLFLDPLNGPVLNDFTKRKNKAHAVESVQNQLDTIEEPTLLVAGYWQAMLEVNRRDGLWRNPKVKTVYLEKPEVLEFWMEAGYQLRYLPQQAEINDRKHDTNFTLTHGKILEIE
jgi:hypothetical protein